MIAAPQKTPSSRAGQGRALVPFVSTSPASQPKVSLRAGLLAVTCCLALGASAGGAFVFRHALPFGSSKPAASAEVMHGLQDQVARLQQSVDALRTVAAAGHAEEQLRALKHTVDALKGDVDQVRGGAASTVAQLTARIDRADHDPSPKLNEITARLDRMERDGGKLADGQRLADLTSRVDRVEKQVSDPTVTGALPVARPQPVAAPAAKSVTTAVAMPPVKPATLPVAAPAKAAGAPAAAPVKLAALAPAAPGPEETQVAATRAAKPSPDRAAVVSGWVLRDVYDGMALVQARSGGLREIEPGEYLPGAGEVRSIERHGRSWVVLTSRGVIADAVD